MQQVREQVDQRSNWVISKARVYMGGERYRGHATHVAVGEFRRCRIEKALSSDVKSRAKADSVTPPVEWIASGLN